MATATLENRIGERMTRQQRADRIELEQQIEWTEKHLASLRRRLADYPSDEPSPAAAKERPIGSFIMEVDENSRAGELYGRESLTQEEVDALLVDDGDEDQDAERFDGMS